MQEGATQWLVALFFCLYVVGCVSFSHSHVFHHDTLFGPKCKETLFLFNLRHVVWFFVV